MSKVIDWYARAADLKIEMDSGKTYESYDAWQDAKDEYWQCIANARKTTVGKVNPVGFWHAGMSN